MRRVLLASMVVLLSSCLASGCFGRSGTPASVKSSAVRTVVAPAGSWRWVTFGADGVRFSYPAIWRLYRWRFLSSFSYSIAYLGTDREHAPCVTTTSGGATATRCGRPINRLGSGGVLVEWMHWGFPDRSYLDQPGRSTRLGGDPARLYQGPAQQWCRGFGGTASVEAAFKDAAQNWVEMDACIRAGSPSAWEAVIRRMLASTRVSG